MSNSAGYFILMDPECQCCTCRQWMKELGSDHVPILGPEPTIRRDPDGILSEYVFGDVSRMSEVQLDRICRMVARSCGETPEHLRSMLMGEEGLPIKKRTRLICTDVEEGRRIIRFRRAIQKRMRGRRV